MTDEQCILIDELRAEVSSLESQLKQAQEELIAKALPKEWAACDHHWTNPSANGEHNCLKCGMPSEAMPGQRELANFRSCESEVNKWSRRAESAESRLQAVTEAHRWIPVEEKLPKRFDNVLVAHTDTSDGSLTVEEAQMQFDDPKWCLVRTAPCDDAIYLDQQVTHWQPLPAPPTVTIGRTAG
jgi:hypothetical protein